MQKRERLVISCNAISPGDGLRNPEMPDADWEAGQLPVQKAAAVGCAQADLVKDDSDDGKWAAQMDYEVPQSGAQ